MPAPIAIAGATGFIGRALITALGPKQPVIGISRTTQEPIAGHENVSWRACNLLSLQDTGRALAGADTAVYLVHSMTPQHTLTRGSFEDLDLLCADNFARAATACGVRHLVYLSGLMPDDRPLSRHLTSRLEVEQTLEASGIPLTTLRAGMVIGPGGSSFELMSRLVGRLPVVVAPRWTRSKSQAVALQDVIASLTYVLKHPKDAVGSWDIGCPETLTYQQMMSTTAAALGKKPRMLDVPFNVPALSLLGVSLVTGTPRQLVVPLVESLQHTMVAKDGLRLQANAGVTPTSFKAALKTAIEQPPVAKVSKKLRRPLRDVGRDIFFIQRIPMPQGMQASQAAKDWDPWLRAFLKPVARMRVRKPDVYRFYPAKGNVCLLELTYMPDQSSSSRGLFQITGGLLHRASNAKPGHIEFRAILDHKAVLAVVRDSAPNLLQLAKKVSQAALQASVIKLLSRHLHRHTPTVNTRTRSR